MVKAFQAFQDLKKLAGNSIAVSFDEGGSFYKRLHRLGV